ncbi:MAG: DAK2 domain-containing protein [Erysipelotrichaceae bacterium]|nr:DAK2 domain-containing protein [Erysipelotrichaceae bacterium]
MRTIDAATLKAMFLSAANNLYNHYPEIDQLNVFPVPDGDTGMNMNLTVSSGAREIANRPEDDDIFALASSFSRGLLMGARGNSGVITSQIFRGFAKGLEGQKYLNAQALAKAFDSAREVAYKAVMKPVEGTILTVIRESSASLLEFVKRDTTIEEAMAYLVKAAHISLDHTPDLLPVLKEVGVVDSGGAGLVTILEGMEAVVRDAFIERKGEATATSPEPVASPYAGAKIADSEEGFGYCTQFILRLGNEAEKKPFVEKNFKKFLMGHGNSVVIVQDGDIVKVHVHTLTPGNMLNYAQQFGEFVTITIENMTEEHHNIEAGKTATDYSVTMEGKKERTPIIPHEEIPEDAEVSIEKEFGLIAVSSGAGLDELFRELGVDVLVSGGQTMNPSTEDFVKAIKATKARNVFLLPNNSNIVMAASQACDVMEGSGVFARVIPSKTIPQGMSSCMAFNPELTPDEIFRDMKAALKNVKSGSVTYAIKDTEIEGVHITKDYYLAMKDKAIVSCVKDKFEALNDLIDSLLGKNSYMLTVLAGEDITDEDLEKVEADLSEKYGDDLEIDVKRGDQPVYSFLIGVE